MTLARALREKLCTQELTHSTYGGRSFHGDASWSTASVTYPCRVDGHQHLVKGSDGRDVVARASVYVSPTSTGGIPSIAVTDKVTLPDSSIAKILTVDTLRDLDGVSHQVLHTG